MRPSARKRGHSLLHLRKDRSRLVTELRKWAMRYGYSRKFANASFKSDALKKGIVHKAFALYKLGLRLKRSVQHGVDRHREESQISEPRDPTVREDSSNSIGSARIRIASTNQHFRKTVDEQKTPQ